jgi:hypothetical protein
MAIVSKETESYTCTCDRCGHVSEVVGGQAKIAEEGWARLHVQSQKMTGPGTGMGGDLCPGCFGLFETWMKPPAA